VINFFRLYHLLPPLWISQLHFPPRLQLFKLKKLLSKQEELDKDFRSYVLAHEQLRQETGLLYLHLNKTDHLHKTLIVHDKLNIAHALDLDQMEFLVQKRADLVYPALATLVQSEGLEVGKEAISALVHLLGLRCAKGIFDKDPDLNTNFGFIGRMPVQIDIGRFCPEEQRATPESYRNEIVRVTDNFRQWLDQNYPLLSAHLLQEIQHLDIE
jgi:hypothetical protein